MKLATLFVCLMLLDAVGRAQLSTLSTNLILGQQMQLAVLHKQDLTEIRRILNAGFKIDDPIGCGTFNAVDGAVAVENVTMLKFLLASGAKPKGSALLQAVWSRHPDISEQMVGMLLQAGANPNYKSCYMGDTNRFSTPLHIACYQGYFKVVQLLVSQPGVELNNVDIDGYTPLMQAVAKGNQEIVALLLARGANPNIAKQRVIGVAQTIDGTTPLEWANQMGRDDLANLLRSATGTRGPSVPQPPSRQEMRALAQRIAAGDERALDELARDADALYQGINFQTDHVRIRSNLLCMKAAFDVLGREAGKGNAAAFQALKKSMSVRRLSSFAPDALGIAAAAGNKEALDILLHYQESDMLESTAIFALAKPVQAGVDPAIDCVGAWLAHLQYGLSSRMVMSTTNALAVAAARGNQKAQAILNQFAARME